MLEKFSFHFEDECLILLCAFKNMRLTQILEKKGWKQAEMTKFYKRRRYLSITPRDALFKKTRSLHKIVPWKMHFHQTSSRGRP